MRVQYIAELLFTHECVIVPGLGGFLTSYVPARIDQEANRFFPPSCKIAFNASLSANDGILANHIANSSGISYREAVEEIRRWVEKSYKLMHAGEKLELEDIGYLQLNSEGNLLFESRLKVNFLGNSFGLPSFYIKTVDREESRFEKETPRVKSWPSKLKYLVPETLKWAAVLAPFIAFTLWGSLNTSKISNYVQSYSGMFSWVRTTPGKTATLPANTYVNPAAFSTPGTNVVPSGVSKEVSPDFNPTSISYTAIRSKGLLKEETPVAEVKSTNPVTCAYYIIGGAFREHSNALKLIEELKSKGYPAAIIDTTLRGMYVVSIKGFSGRSEASGELPGIREAGYTGAWIMRKS
jgi:hypothetical protein